jgi:diguanylate cyclase (GGDEF)-like protein/PAS domain S-box-containing protein
MRMLARRPTTAFAAGASAAALLVAFGTQGQAATAFGFAALTLAAVLGAELDPQPRTADRAMMPLWFVAAFCALLFLGPNAMTLVATAGLLTRALVDAPSPDEYRGVIVDVGVVIVATQAAGAAQAMLGALALPPAWPWPALPLTAALIAYCAIWTGFGDFVSSSSRSAETRPRARRLLRAFPTHVIGAAVAVLFVQAIDHAMWTMVPVGAVPVYFAYAAYVTYVARASNAHHHAGPFVQPLAIVDPHGHVIAWNDACSDLVKCPRGHAVGHPIADLLPPLAERDLPRAIGDVLQTRRPRTLPDVSLDSPQGERILQIDLLPHGEAVAIRLHDVTDRTLRDRAAHRTAESLALAAEGARDGLWEWDLHAHELYVSARWRAMLGLTPREGSVRSKDVFDRMHADDRGPFNASLEAHLAAQTEHLEHEIRLRHEDGTYRWFLCRGLAVRESGRRPSRIAGSLTDVSSSAVVREQAQITAFRDPLTGLCNRSVFVEGLGQRLAELKQRRGSRFAVLYLDLDRFKVVNDSLGHLVGDQLLTAVSRRLESCLRSVDALARLGGDEFAILLNGLEDATQANAIAFRIQETLGVPFAIADREVVTSASIGIAFSKLEYANPEEIMRDADTAMYHAKQHGKARHELFDADMHARELDRLGFEGDLRRAVKSQAFEVHYQPIVSLATGMCAGFESLVRWNRNGQTVSPVQFIPVAEELGLIEPLGTWVLQEACRTFADWQRRFPSIGLEYITVNVSTRQLMQQGFVYIVEQAVGASGLKPSDVRLEITETALMDTPQVAAQVLSDLRNFGVKIYLDDFGTGYSSLSHLHKLPVDALKIDRSFVRSLTLDDRPAIVESILALARTLNTSVVAEGVETEQQAMALRRLGCTLAQGFFYSRPVPVDAIEQILRSGRPLGGTGVVESVAAPPVVRTEKPAAPPPGFEWPPAAPARRGAGQLATRAVRGRSQRIA